MITYIASVCMETNNASASRDEGMRRVTYYVHRQLYSYPVKSKSRSIGRSIKRGQSAAQNTLQSLATRLSTTAILRLWFQFSAHTATASQVLRRGVPRCWSGHRGQESLFRGPGPCSYDQIDVEIFTNPLINFCSNT